ncbi:hypothetical protein FJY90_00550 [Candidatus Gottesmanbacteria bacterium]|nr:hypothetical protein [Candidatus Gottesmanbacteria bacterium]
MNKTAPIVNDVLLNNKVQKKPLSYSSANANKFAEVLENQKRYMEVKFSTHAQERLKQQNINITSQEISMINEATKKAEIKGSKESLILLKDLALVVNISNKTVITAIDKTRQKDKIFTNIDSTVIL